MKKLIAFILAAAICASVCGCNNSGTSHVIATPAPESSSVPETTVTTTTVTTTVTTTAATTTTPVTTTTVTTPEPETTTPAPTTAAPIPDETITSKSFALYANKDSAAVYADAECKKVINKLPAKTKVKAAETDKEKQVYKLEEGTYVKMEDFEKKGSEKILAVAKSQLGNVGGEPYWRWCGFESRIEWCAAFVCWCADQCGYLNEENLIPFFLGCYGGAEWFMEHDLWEPGGYEPVAGQIIFLDWNYDGSADHVGFVDRVEDGYVWTVEGNADDLCKQRHYSISNQWILGYGTPDYPY